MARQAQTACSSLAHEERIWGEKTDKLGPSGAVGFAFVSSVFDTSSLALSLDGDVDLMIPRHPKYFIFLTPMETDSIGSTLSFFFVYRDFGFPG
eukprot:CAMPEP_0197273466 /NCGR_PEP_ID=MMETSP1432-20130617/11329_1 /TAXON_ID=44447 /ORGANISM="Pseudo-nitzschia delicatissima, Strain UNC1205" /LENGTH=93 /DNA_ID=CAMNT_0042739131 /DNA_START=328 /DNA_END=609 /DNA_ORIENTATION=+